MTLAQIYPGLEWNSTPFFNARYVILAYNSQLEDHLTGGPCEIPEAMIAAGNGSTMLAGFNYNCPAAHTLETCEIFVKMRLYP